MNYTDYRITDMQWLPQVKSKRSSAKRAVKNILLVLTALLVFLAAYFPLTYRWAQTTWSDLTVREIIYHLTMPAEGTATNMLMQHITRCLIPAIVIAAAFVVVMIVIRKKATAASFVKGGAAAVAGIIVMNTVAAFWTEMDVTEYMESQSSYSSFIDGNYVDPASVNLKFPEEKRNLIYIFLESMENTFSDTASGGGFEEDVIPELTQLSLENENFSGGDTQLDGGVPMTGATWTIGAMFAQTSGLPLTISVGGNEMGSQDEFFPGATTLGDILEDNGYNQTLLLGSDGNFGGRTLYFSTHGNYSIKDYNYYIDNGTIPEDYYVWWGYEDLYLFENAKTELNELSAQDGPFNLTMLTVDTHFEDGYVCSLCGNEYDDQYSNVYRCASRQVSEFIDWCSNQDWYENTTIVISGDHLTMDADFCENVSNDYQRTVYTTVINGAAQPEEETYREYTTFDMFPTTLAAMGVEIPGNKLGLGTNLYSSENTLLEVYGYEDMDSGLQAKSELMENLTAGITAPSCKIEVLGYDDTTGAARVVVSDISVAGLDDVKGVVANVNKEGKADTRQYVFEDRGDGSYICTIYFSDFDYDSGTYNITVQVQNGDGTRGNEFNIGYATVEMGSVGENSPAEENTATYGYNIGNFDYTTGTFEVTYARYDMENVAGVQVAVWKEEDQSDLKWISASKGEDGIFRAYINVFDYAFDDRSFYVDLYEVMNDGTSQVIKRKFYRVGEE
jgi:phosphoglycerol transferase